MVHDCDLHKALKGRDSMTGQIMDSRMNPG